ncbi:MAG: response regulator [Planctomycetes bacterium]|nr:response regulator [Planctomycetota bacterium]
MATVNTNTTDQRNAVCVMLEHFLSELDREGDITGAKGSLIITLCNMMANALGLPDAERETLINSARLIRALKVKMPYEIATVRGGLTESQLQVVCSALMRNVDMIRSTGILTAEADVLESVHEWWDGSGICNGLEGENIPVGSRILSIVSAYATMREGSTYTDLHSGEEAWIEIESDTGSHFDPKLVSKFRKVLEDYYADRHDTASGNILLVEDDEHTAAILSRRLGWAGYEVTTYNNADDALENATQDGWHAIIMDLMMPGTDGISLCKQLRDKEELNAIPIIITTCRSDKDALQESSEAGANAFSIKPVHFEPFLKYLAECRDSMNEEMRVIAN